MFHDDQPGSGRGSQWAIAGLSLLSVTALVMTIWIMADFYREQEILRKISQHLPSGFQPEANELAIELRLQSRLSVLLILNILASCVALTLLVRAYVSSERSLRSVRVLATDVLACLDQGVITTDDDGTILSINPRGRELLGDLPDGTEIALGDLSTAHRSLEEMRQRVMAAPDTVGDCDYTLQFNGNVRKLRAGCTRLRDHQQRQIGTVIHIRDVTEKTLMEQRLRRMERYMGLGSLAAGLQHEIKNPLSALSLHIQLLREAISGDADSESIDESLDVLSAEVRRIAKVLENFRDFASVAELNRTNVDLKELIGKIVKLTGPQAREQGIQLGVSLPQEEVPCLSLDAVRIEQVILNLLVNSFAAMPDGGQVTIRLRTRADSVVIEVADTGCGIPVELRDKVFDPYFTTRNQGTGMGLALCEKIVRQHDGAIEFRTGPQGTTFTVTLPARVRPSVPDSKPVPR